MEVDIDASVPKLKKQGKLHALKNISKLGKITYHALGFIGENMVKTEVIARYLTAEVQATQDGSNSDMSITPDNYKFQIQGHREPLWTRRVRNACPHPSIKRLDCSKASCGWTPRPGCLFGNPARSSKVLPSS